MAEKNGIATAQEIRAYAESLQWSAPETVPLPKSGWNVVLRRPTKYYWMLRRTEWPADMIERFDAVGSGHAKEILTPGDVRTWLQAHNEMSMAAFVQPRASLKPGSDEIDIRWLPDEDRKFIGSFLGGQVDAHGVPLEAFRAGEQGSAETGGNNGDAVQVPAD